ncbi:hypothetical protein FDI31_gp01 [Acinetobacter phage vB_AbaP_B3]|uniref:Uncharacterized protein n=1 Tax=Acinetobacter phage vB_AbaP_B3 TaxID=2016050 RepID=A0A221SBI6_9CAUD|nr:hypothetical protein FDI31_gp01 [Acinetobacter phage vB_AbaP_B3]ASN73360.1 hypothetical protein B3_01 [Acinetobacter phage vB_AbaP_B3]
MYSARSIGRVSLINGSISVLINYYRKVLGSFSERLYWFGSLPLCISISFYSYLYVLPIVFSFYTSMHFLLLYVLSLYLFILYLLL